MKPEFSFRDYGPSDFATLIGEIHSEEELHRCTGTDFHWPLDVAQLQKHLDEVDQCSRFILQRDGIAVAYGDIRYDQEGEGRLCRLLVFESWRNQGIGKILVQLLCDQVKIKDPGMKVTLNVLVDNPAARRCYEACGFTYMDQKIEIEVAGKKRTIIKMIRE